MGAGALSRAPRARWDIVKKITCWTVFWLAVATAGAQTIGNYVRKHATGTISTLNTTPCGGNAITQDEVTADTFYCNGSFWIWLGRPCLTCGAAEGCVGSGTPFQLTMFDSDGTCESDSYSRQVTNLIGLRVDTAFSGSTSKTFSLMADPDANAVKDEKFYCRYNGQCVIPANGSFEVSAIYSNKDDTDTLSSGSDNVAIRGILDSRQVAASEHTTAGLYGQNTANCQGASCGFSNLFGPATGVLGTGVAGTNADMSSNPNSIVAGVIGNVTSNAGSSVNFLDGVRGNVVVNSTYSSLNAASVFGGKPQVGGSTPPFVAVGGHFEGMDPTDQYQPSYFNGAVWAKGDVRIEDPPGSANLTRSRELQFKSLFRQAGAVGTGQFTMWRATSNPDGHLDTSDSTHKNFHYEYPRLLDATYSNYVLTINGAPTETSTDITALTKWDTISGAGGVPSTRTLQGGTGVDIDGSDAALDLSANRIFTFDPTEVGTVTFGSGSNFSWTFDTTGSASVQPRIDFQQNYIGFGGGTATSLNLRWMANNGTNYTQLKADAQTVDLSYKWPLTGPTTGGKYLTSDTAGQWAWASLVAPATAGCLYVMDSEGNPDTSQSDEVCRVTVVEGDTLSTGRYMAAGSTTNPGVIMLAEAPSNGTDYVAIQAPVSLGTKYTYVLPNQVGTTSNWGVQTAPFTNVYTTKITSGTPNFSIQTLDNVGDGTAKDRISCPSFVSSPAACEVRNADLAAGTGGTITATTAASLAADPAACPSSQWARDQNASGVLTCSQPGFSDISGSIADPQVPDTLVFAELDGENGPLNIKMFDDTDTPTTWMQFVADTDGLPSTGKVNIHRKLDLNNNSLFGLAGISCNTSPCLTDTNISDTLTSSIFKGSGTTTDAVDLGTAEAAGTLAAARFPALTGDVTTSAGSVATTIVANAVALTTDTTGNYANGDAEAGNALVTNALDTTGASVDVSAAAPPILAGQAVVATSATAAAWQHMQPMQALNRRWGFWSVLSTASTSFTGYGAANPTVAGTPTSQPALANRYYIRYASGATSGNVGGITGGYVHTRPAYRPRYLTRIMTDSAITTRRIWVGLAESTLEALSPNTTGGASGIDFVAIAYEDGQNSGKWMCCSGDGTNWGCTDTGITVATSTEYAMAVDWSTSGTLSCLIDTTVTTRTGNLSTAAVDIGQYNALTTLDNNARNHHISGSISLDQN